MIAPQSVLTLLRYFAGATVLRYGLIRCVCSLRECFLDGDCTSHGMIKPKGTAKAVP